MKSSTNKFCIPYKDRVQSKKISCQILSLKQITTSNCSQKSLLVIKPERSVKLFSFGTFWGHIYMK